MVKAVAPKQVREFLMLLSTLAIEIPLSHYHNQLKAGLEKEEKSKGSYKMPPRTKLRLEQTVGYLAECLSQREETINKIMKVLAGPNQELSIERSKLFNSLVSSCDWLK